MFIRLLGVNFLVSSAVCLIVIVIFRRPVNRILERIVGEEIYTSWSRYVGFALYIVGISGGVRVWDLEKYITPDKETGEMLVLTSDRWTLELYRSVVGTLQSDTWMLLIFFLFALVAFVIVKGFESKRQPRST
ncbi:MAG: hypothetical protein ACE5HU_00335 [Acidobacteriota bacterium]